MLFNLGDSRCLQRLVPLFSDKLLSLLLNTELYSNFIAA